MREERERRERRERERERRERGERERERVIYMQMHANVINKGQKYKVSSNTRC